MSAEGGLQSDPFALRSAEGGLQSHPFAL